MTEPLRDRTPTPAIVRVTDLYRRVARVYDPFRSLWSRWTRPIEAALDESIAREIGRRSRILELAPGTGINVGRLLRQAPGFDSYLGIDASPEMLARAGAVARGDSRIELRLGDVTRLELDGRFDLVVSAWLFSHLEDPVSVARAALERLREGSPLPSLSGPDTGLGAAGPSQPETRLGRRERRR